MTEKNGGIGEEARAKYLKRVENLANALGKSRSAIRKMLNSEAARKIFEADPRLQEWEKENFPDPDKFDPNDQ